MRAGLRWSRPIAAAVLLLVVAGCGVPTTGGAVPLPDDLAELAPSSAPAPYELAQPTAPATVTDLVWVRDGKLRLSARAVAAGDAATQAAAALSAAIAGPTPEELARGMSTEVPPDLQASLQLDGAAAVVDLQRPGEVTGGGNVTLAIAQLALAVLLVPGIDSVTFTVDGAPAEVPRADGQVRSGPVTLSDYTDLLAAKSVP